MTPFEPANVENTFGLPVEQHVDTPVLGNMGDYSSVNVNTTPTGQMSLFGGSGEALDTADVSSTAGITGNSGTTATESAAVQYGLNNFEGGGGV